MQGAQEVPVDNLHVHRYNKDVYGKPDDGLKDSIREFGLRRPIRINEEGAILSGARRWTAFRALERSTIPAVKMDLPSEEAERKEILLANAYRGEKSPRVRMQEADAYYELFQQGDVSKDDLRDAAGKQEMEPQNDRPFCLAAAAAGLPKTDYNGLQRVFHSDRLKGEIDRAEDEEKIDGDTAEDLRSRLFQVRQDVEHGTASPSAAARRISEALHAAIEDDGPHPDDDDDPAEKSEREEAYEAIDLALRRGNQFVEAMREVSEKHADYLEREDGPSFRRILRAAALHVEKIVEAAGWKPQAESEEAA